MMLIPRRALAGQLRSQIHLDSACLASRMVSTATGEAADKSVGAATGAAPGPAADSQAPPMSSQPTTGSQRSVDEAPKGKATETTLRLSAMFANIKRAAETPAPQRRPAAHTNRRPSGPRVESPTQHRLAPSQQAVRRPPQAGLQHRPDIWTRNDASGGQSSTSAANDRTTSSLKSSAPSGSNQHLSDKFKEMLARPLQPSRRDDRPQRRRNARMADTLTRTLHMVEFEPDQVDWSEFQSVSSPVSAQSATPGSLSPLTGLSNSAQLVLGANPSLSVDEKQRLVETVAAIMRRSGALEQRVAA